MKQHQTNFFTASGDRWDFHFRHDTPPFSKWFGMLTILSLSGDGRKKKIDDTICDAVKKAEKASKSTPKLPKGTPIMPNPKEHEFLKELERVKSKSDRTRWVDDQGHIYEWDSRHGELEVYDERGRHIGVRDPRTGHWTKAGKPGRRIEP